MSNSRKVIWISFALFMFFQLGTSYLTHQNQNNLGFLLQMKDHIPFMLYFSISGVIFFLLSFMVYQMDRMKAKKKIAQLDQDKNELKAKLFDMQEEQAKNEATQSLPDGNQEDPKVIKTPPLGDKETEETEEKPE